ncbi:MAG: aryl-sulfate sulfotransferase [Myxococcales bacterium]|nr:aryl-sulfate sulfotransferase [Myxococcales bacterium]
MRAWISLGWLCACTPEGTTQTVDEPVDPSTAPTVGPDPCEAEPGLEITSLTLSQPWSEHELQATVALTAPAAVAVACTRDDDSDEVHLVESVQADEDHVLRLAGLLADAAYTCMAAAVCPSSEGAPAEAAITTAEVSNPDLPGIEVTVHDEAAGRDYVLTNHQRDAAWNGQRRLVFDREGRIRWHAAPNAGQSVGGSAVGWSASSRAFTIGGGWPPNNNGRPQQIELFGSEVRYDTAPVLPDYDSTLFHHEARELRDGRFLTLEEPTIQGTGGGTFRGFGVRLVDPATDRVVFDYTSQRGHDEGHLPGGGGDVYHANWADVATVRGQDVLYVSLCTQRWIVAVDVPSGDWRWRFGRGGDFALVDADGAPLPDSDFPQCQHGLQMDGEVLLVYDNGSDRQQSRAVAFSLDEETRVATRLWTWTEGSWFQRSLGGVDWTAQGVLISMGHIASTGQGSPQRSTFVEIEPSQGTKLWEARYRDAADMAFRAQAIEPCELFRNAADCGEVRGRLDALQEVLAR